MKFTLGLLALVLTTAGNAQAANQTPVEHAKVRVLMMKTWQEQKSDGSYETKFEKICDKVGSAVVVRENAKPPMSSEDSITCETDLRAGASRITTFGFITYNQGADLFGDGQKSEFKLYGASAFVQSVDGKFVDSIPFNYAATNDLNQKSMVLYSGGGSLRDKNVPSVIEENISILYKFEQ